MSDAKALIPINDDEDLGPKMRALLPRQRAFVRAMVLNGGDHKRAYYEAGYNPSNEHCARAAASFLKHKPQVIEAMQEVAWQLMHSEALPAVSALQALVRNPNHKDHYKAIEAILARTGFVAFTGQIQKTDNKTDRELVNAIREIAVELGVDPKRLLGNRGDDANVIEGEAVTLDDDTHSTEGLEDIL